MPTPSKGPRLGGSPAHERLILANLAQSLFEHGKITTTETKAKRLRPLAEKLITSAKRGTLHSRREVMKTIRDKNVVHTLFADIAPAVADRPGGYTRIVKILPRKGDNAPMAIIEIITEELVSSAAGRVARRAATTSDRSARPKQAKAGAADEVATDEVATDEVATDEVATDEASADEVSADEVATDEAAFTDGTPADAVDEAIGASESADDTESAETTSADGNEPTAKS